MPESLLKLHSLLVDEKRARMGCKGEEITVIFNSSQFSLDFSGQNVFKSQEPQALKFEMHILGDLKASNNQIFIM